MLHLRRGVSFASKFKLVKQKLKLIKIKKMKNFRFSNKLLMGATIAMAMSVSFSSCSDDDEDDDTTPTGKVETTRFITADETWAGDEIHVLDKRTIVTDGATLTIEPGAIVKGEPGSESDAKPLIIAQGAKIMAKGTAAKPIIFTSSSDNIAVGQITGTNNDENTRGQWAGLIILGRAPISPSAGITARIEGIPPTVTEGIYGGNDPADNSGVLEYVSIRHGGVELVPGGGNEINGLTLGGVGSGTTISHIEVVANLDDGIEWFGGTVDVSNAIVGYQGDDAFDIDQAYSGTITNIAYIAGLDSDHALEIDGPEGSANSNGAFTMTAGYLQGNPDPGSGEFADFRSNAKGNVNNLYFFNFKEGADVELDADDLDDDDRVSSNYNSGVLSMEDCVFNTDPFTVTLEDIASDKLASPIAGFDFDAEFAANNSLSSTAPSNGFVKAEFTGWTWFDANGELSQF